MRLISAAALIACATVTATASGLAADSTNGSQLAKKWCANCHAVDDKSAGTVPQGPPTFVAVARGGKSTEELSGFLAHPHGKMPDLSLTRIEISDLMAYIDSLR